MSNFDYVYGCSSCGVGAGARCETAEEENDPSRSCASRERERCLGVVSYVREKHGEVLANTRDADARKRALAAFLALEDVEEFIRNGNAFREGL